MVYMYHLSITSCLVRYKALKRGPPASCISVSITYLPQVHNELNFESHFNCILSRMIFHCPQRSSIARSHKDVELYAPSLMGLFEFDLIIVDYAIVSNSVICVIVS